jgi:hypothetical protein
VRIIAGRAAGVADNDGGTKAGVELINDGWVDGRSADGNQEIITTRRYMPYILRKELPHCLSDKLNRRRPVTDAHSWRDPSPTAPS